jgi:hypothetical protein
VGIEKTGRSFVVEETNQQIILKTNKSSTIQFLLYRKLGVDQMWWAISNQVPFVQSLLHNESGRNEDM